MKTAINLLLASVLGMQSLGAAELFCFSSPDGKSGLKLAWRDTPESPWTPFDHTFVSSDFGPWGSHKKMFAPKLMLNAADSLWTAVWTADPAGEVTALATSPDLLHWTPQRYFASPSDLPRDLRPLRPVTSDSVMIDGKMMQGWRMEIDDALPARLNAEIEKRRHRAALAAQVMADDPTRFANLAPVNVTVKAGSAPSYPISDKLIGIFFEDINYGADGGLYGELVQNRDFEYLATDQPGWGPTTAWTVEGAVTVDSVSPIHANNPHYLKVSGDARLINEGWDGFTLTKGETYDFSARIRTARKSKARVELIDSAGNVIASAPLTLSPSMEGDWAEVTASLKPRQSARDARLSISFPSDTRADVDIISLFPRATFKGRKNGLRKDLAQTLADLHPRFMRFPGGCVAHGNGTDNIYDWKGSIGPLEARRPLRNIWRYHQTRGLGYHEYFLFCEDLGMEPLPVVAAGVCCQNSGRPAAHSHDALTTYGQQCGIPFDRMDSYVQDVLDLIEYANGDPATSPWAAMRAEAGHPEPFNLKYIGIGNEDQITEVFEVRFKMIYDAVRARYPEIKVVGTAGPFYEGSDYDAGWEIARREGVDLVDEHYYVSPGWLINNQNFYDSYDRQGPKVYLGEWASHLDGRPNNLETALSGALYLTAVERNADVVEMSSYAPLLARRGHTQWRPDMIYFDNDSIRLTPDYEVQRLFGNNCGSLYHPSDVKVDAQVNSDVTARIGVSVVTDADNGDLIVKLANLLPVEANVDVDLSALLSAPVASTKALRISGTPTQITVTPEEVDVTLPHATLPPYSFTVLRIPASK